jgi:hypothetical protein
VVKDALVGEPHDSGGEEVVDAVVERGRVPVRLLGGRLVIHPLLAKGT